jgi:integrase
MATKNGKVRSVDAYLTLLKSAGKSDFTIRNYRQTLTQYARFLNVPPEKLHEHLNADDLMRYADSISGQRDSTRKYALSVLGRYLKLNGVEFDELESNVFARVQITDEIQAKPLTVQLLQKMLDSGDAHSRAIITFLTSTGCRIGETAQLRLSDVGRIENGAFVSDINGSVVRVRNEIAKRKKGGLVFLTAEAREYLSLWLKNRNMYIINANERTSRLFTDKIRPAKDDRLFGCTDATIGKIFNVLYRLADGEMGETRSRITVHSCRAYFRTNAAKTMGIDLVEGILRHTGYLNNQYVKMTPEDKETQFHEGEPVLFITRADHRIQSSKLDSLAKENKELKERLATIEALQNLAVAKPDAGAMGIIRAGLSADEIRKIVLDTLLEAQTAKAQ